MPNLVAVSLQKRMCNTVVCSFISFVILYGLCFILRLFFTRELNCCFCCVACASFTRFYRFSIWFAFFASVVQLLCSLSGWLHLNCSSIGTVFNGAETNCRFARNLDILLM